MAVVPFAAINVSRDYIFEDVIAAWLEAIGAIEQRFGSWAIEAVL